MCTTGPTVATIYGLGFGTDVKIAFDGRLDLQHDQRRRLCTHGARSTLGLADALVIANPPLAVRQAMRYARNPGATVCRRSI